MSSSSSAAPSRKPYRKAPPQHRETRHDLPTALKDELDGGETLTDADRVKILQHQNEELRRRLTYTAHKMEVMESEFESGRLYMETEMGRALEEMEKLKDKFRRLQNNKNNSKQTNQNIVDVLIAVFLQVKKMDMDRKTLDWEIVELTNKLLDAKTTIDRLEELNERYRQDCNLAVQLLKCNKSHFRNHKFADLPCELQEMVNKHLQTNPEFSSSGTQSVAPSDTVPTSVIARVLEKPEPLLLNSAKSCSGRPVAEDVFVHVDMSGTPAGTERGQRLADKEGTEQVPAEGGKQHNGLCGRQNVTESPPDEGLAFETLNPYPTPTPPHPMYPGRKVIEFSDDKVKIPKNSPLPNCTYATRQAISLSLVQGEEDGGQDRHRTVPNSPVSEGRRSLQAPSGRPYSRGSSTKLDASRGSENEPRSLQSSPFSSPPQVPSTFASSASSEEDLLSNWQRMFVEKVAPSSETSFIHRTSFSHDTAQDLQKTLSRSMQELGKAAPAYSDREDCARSCGWTPSRGSSLDADNVDSLAASKSHYVAERPPPEDTASQPLLQTCEMGEAAAASVMAKASPLAKRKDYVDMDSPGSSAEEREVLLQESRSVGLTAEDAAESPPSSRPHRSPKRMGVHHLHRKDSLTRAQEHGNLLN
nr:PREDICTED: tight junction-associated protein 1 [Latimeria chalumnae]|eukprot:XP_006002668.1 PREDICTED: tight junction-associated protein 1 [Latimeria chalumnae]